MDTLTLLQTYLNSFTKLQAGRVSSILTKQFRTNTGIKSRAEILEGFFNEGAIIKESRYLVPITPKIKMKMQLKRSIAFKNAANSKNIEEKTKSIAEHRELGEQLSSGLVPVWIKEIVLFNGDTLVKPLLEEIKYIEYLTEQNNKNK